MCFFLLNFELVEGLNTREGRRPSCNRLDSLLLSRRGLGRPFLSLLLPPLGLLLSLSPCLFLPLAPLSVPDWRVPRRRTGSDSVPRSFHPTTVNREVNTGLSRPQFHEGSSQESWLPRGASLDVGSSRPGPHQITRIGPTPFRGLGGLDRDSWANRLPWIRLVARQSWAPRPVEGQGLYQEASGRHSTPLRRGRGAVWGGRPLRASNDPRGPLSRAPALSQGYL